MASTGDGLIVDPNHQSVLHFAGEGPVHRSALTQGKGLVADFDGMTTVHELGQYVFLANLAENPIPHPAQKAYGRAFCHFPKHISVTLDC